MLHKSSTVTPIAPPGGGARIVACPHPFRTLRIEDEAPAGTTIRQILDQLHLAGDHLHARVCIDDRLIPTAEWEYAMPAAGQLVTVRVIPTGGDGGGKDVLRIVAMIAVVAVSAWVTGGGLGAVLPDALGMAFGSGTTAAAVAGATIGIALSLASVALIPPPKQQMDRLSSGSASTTSPTLSLTGSRNQFAPYGPVPQVLGTHRMFPPLAARTYTEIQGTDQYLHGLFTFGYGPLILDNFKIGETALSEFSGVELAIIDNYNGSDSIPLFPGDAYEDGLSVLLTQADGWQNRTTQPNATEISVDVAFPQGLVEFGSTGSTLARTVQLEMQYRAVGASSWINVDQPAVAATASTAFGGNRDLKFTAATPGYNENSIWVEYYEVSWYSPGFFQVSYLGQVGIRVAVYMAPGSTANQIMTALNTHASSVFSTSLATGSDGTGVVTAPDNPVVAQLAGGSNLIESHVFTDNRATLLRYSRRWHVPPGQYEVQIRRVTADNVAAAIRDQCYWTMVRTFQAGGAVRKQGATLAALRIKATDQLNGTLDELNATATTVCLDWDGTGWVMGPTNNPASLVRYVLEGKANARRIPVARIDLLGLQGWHGRCVAGGRTYNAVRDFSSTVYETLRDICTIGRASPTMRDGQFSVVEDLLQANASQIFSPRNSWGFKSTKTLTTRPHALRCRFVNAEKGYQQDVRIVYDDGYNADGTGGLTAATLIEDFDLPGCDNAGLAYRHGRYNIAVNKLRPELFSLSSDFENLTCTRGDKVEVVHDVPMLAMGQARIKSVTMNGSDEVTGVTLDDSLLMVNGQTYGLRIRRRDGQQVLVGLVTVAGPQTALTPSTPIPTTLVEGSRTPGVGDLVTFGLAGQESTPMLVKAIEPGPDLSAKLTLVEYAPGVQTADTEPIPAYNSNITQPAQDSALLAQPIVAQVVSDETVLVRAIDGSLESRVVISVSFASGYRMRASAIQVQFRQTGSTGPWTNQWTVLPTTQDIIVTGVEDGVTYDIRLRAENTGAVSEWTVISGHTVIGKTSAPGSVQGFTATMLEGGSGVLLRWTPNVELDVAAYEIRNGASWDTAVQVSTIGATSYTAAAPAAGTQTYLIKAIDVVGNASIAAASVNLSVIPPQASNPSGTFDGQDFVMTWSANPGSYPIAEYEIRYGDTFSGATVVQRVRATGYRQRATWIGPRTWWVVAIDLAGNQGAESGTTATVTPAATTTISPLVIDNNVLLRWTATQGTIPIAGYEIRRGTLYGSAESIGTADTTFSIIMETLKGVKTYWVVPRDTAGNVGTELSITVSADGPPDFILRDTFRSDCFDDRTNVQRIGDDRVSLSFDGVDDYVIVNPFSQMPATTVTIEFNIKSTGSGDGLISYAVAGQADEVLVTNQEALAIAIRGTLVSTGYAVNDGAWHRCAVRWRSSDGTVQLVVDGAQRYSTTGVQTGASITNSGSLVFGCDQDSVGGALGEFMPGELDEIRIWNEFRSTADISNNDNKELIGTETNLTGYWRLNERQSAVANDLSNADLDGDIVGALWHVPTSSCIAPFYTAETVADRESIHGYTTPQAQITANYPYVAQPVPTSATLTAYYDAGTVLPATRILVSLTEAIVAAGVSVSIQISVRQTTGAAWTDLTAGPEGIANTFRYVKVALSWTSDGKGVARYDAIDTVLRVKLKTDAGTVTVTANPTTVTFNESFLDVESIVATPRGTADRKVVVDFADVVNPTTFDLYLFNSAGAAATGDVSWQVRGA